MLNLLPDFRTFAKSLSSISLRAVLVAVAVLRAYPLYAANLDSGQVSDAIARPPDTVLVWRYPVSSIRPMLLYLINK